MAGGKCAMTEYISSMRKYIGHERLLIVGASVFVHKNGKLLLQKRKDNGCWADHGGCCELGETVEETAKRELYEETGLTAHSLELLGIFSGKELFYTYPNGDKVSNVNIAYLCDDFSGDIKFQTNETTDLRWFDLDELPESISPPVKPVLEKCLDVLKNRMESKIDFEIVLINEQYREHVNNLVEESWGSTNVVTRGVLHDTRTHPGFVAICNSTVVGYILYNMADGDCEITVLESLREKQGIGGTLTNAIIELAKNTNCRRVWLITTNDNTHAVYAPAQRPSADGLARA